MVVHITHPFSGLARRSLTKTNRKIDYNLHGSASNKFTKFHSNRMSGLARRKVRTNKHTHTHIHFYILDLISYFLWIVLFYFILGTALCLFIPYVKLIEEGTLPACKGKKRVPPSLIRKAKFLPPYPFLPSHSFSLLYQISQVSPPLPISPPHSSLFFPPSLSPIFRRTKIFTQLFNKFSLNY
jgi:hypothetical protein